MPVVKSLAYRSTNGIFNITEYGVNIDGRMGEAVIFSSELTKQAGNRCVVWMSNDELKELAAAINSYLIESEDEESTNGG